MSLLSDLPDDILNLISIRLNGFDNCSLWMASNSILRQRLVNNVITDFDIKYTIPGRYLWPGNFLKKLQKLSRLSLVVDKDMFHILIKNVELFPIPTLKYLKLECKNASQMLKPKLSFDDSTGPTISSDNNYINLNEYYSNLEHLEIITSWIANSLSIDFLRFLPQKLQTLSIPKTSFKFDKPTSHNNLNTSIEILPRTLTSLSIRMEYRFLNTYLDFSRLPPKLTSLTTNVNLDQNSYHMIPKSLKVLSLETNTNSIEKLSPCLPSGLECLVVDINGNTPTSQLFKHLDNLETLYLRTQADINIDDLIRKCPPKLKRFTCSNFAITELVAPSRLFTDCLTTMTLNNLSGINAHLIASLPQSLTNLTIYHHSRLNPFAFFSSLPRNLKSFATDQIVVDNTSMLPESLTSLSLTTSTPTDASRFDRLPPKLQVLVATSNFPRSIMMQLPISLESLSVSSSEVVDDEIIRMLPKGLKKLSLDGKDSITDASIADLPPYLEHLGLLANTGLTDDAVSMLPSTLRSINLPRNPNFTDKCIKHLPRNLISLYLNKGKKITSNSCQDLPQFLDCYVCPDPKKRCPVHKKDSIL